MPFKFNPFTHKLDIVDQSGPPFGTVVSLTGDTGGAVSPDGSGNINVVGNGYPSGIVFTGNLVANTLTLSLPGGGFTWNPESVDFSAVKGNGYLVNHSMGVIHVTLPASPLVGDTFIVADVGGGTFQLVQNAGDSIQLGIDLTTVTTGSITSTNKGDTVMLVCWASGPGASWIAIQPVGNFTVI